MDLVYLDLCCYKRPFDDLTDERVRWEASAVAAIFKRVETGQAALVRSPALALENDRNPREDRRRAAALWMDGATVDAPLTEEVSRRAQELVGLGFPVVDALHVAFAESAGAEYLVTCDDELHRLGGRVRANLKVEVVLPDEYLMRRRT